MNKAFREEFPNCDVLVFVPRSPWYRRLWNWIIGKKPKITDIRGLHYRPFVRPTYVVCDDIEGDC